MVGHVARQWELHRRKGGQRLHGIRDGKLRGFGLRVLPSGRKRFFIHCQHRGERVGKIVGDAGSMDVGEARSRAVEMLAAIRRGKDTPLPAGDTLFETVAEAAFGRYEQVWKPPRRHQAVGAGSWLACQFQGSSSLVRFIL